MALIRPIPRSGGADMTPFIGKKIFNFNEGGATSVGDNEAYIPLSGNTAVITVHQAQQSASIHLDVYGLKSDGTETLLGSSIYGTDNAISVDLTTYVGVHIELITSGTGNATAYATLTSVS